MGSLIKSIIVTLLALTTHAASGQRPDLRLLAVDGGFVVKEASRGQGSYLLQGSADLKNWNMRGAASFDESQERVDLVTFQDAAVSRSFFRLLGPIDNDPEYNLWIVSNPASPHLATLRYGDEYIIRYFGTRDPDTALPAEITHMSVNGSGVYEPFISVEELRENLTVPEDAPTTDEGETPQEHVSEQFSSPPASYAPYTYKKTGLLIVESDSCESFPSRDPIIFLTLTNNTGTFIEEFPLFPEFLLSEGTTQVFEYTIGFTTLGIESDFVERSKAELQKRIDDFYECVPDISSPPSSATAAQKQLLTRLNLGYTALCLLWNFPSDREPFEYPREFVEGFSTKEARYYATILADDRQEVTRSREVIISEEQISMPEFWVTDYDLPQLTLKTDCDKMLVPSTQLSHEGTISASSFTALFHESYPHEEYSDKFTGGQGSASNSASSTELNSRASGSIAVSSGSRSITTIGRTFASAGSETFYTAGSASGAMFFEVVPVPGTPTGGSVEVRLKLDVSNNVGSIHNLRGSVYRHGVNYPIAELTEPGEATFVATEGVIYQFGFSSASQLRKARGQTENAVARSTVKISLRIQD